MAMLVERYGLLLVVHPACGMGATGLEWVALGFFSRQDEDLIDVCPH
jgi:hypothetical protein